MTPDIRDYVGTPQSPQRTPQSPCRGPHVYPHISLKTDSDPLARNLCGLLITSNCSQPAQISCERESVFQWDTQKSLRSSNPLSWSLYGGNPDLGVLIGATITVIPMVETINVDP